MLPMQERAKLLILQQVKSLLPCQKQQQPMSTKPSKLLVRLLTIPTGGGSDNAINRAKLLNMLANKLREHASFFAELDTRNCGKPLVESEIDVADSANCFEYYAGLATKIMGETVAVPANMQSMVLREPVGVCAQIIPWNYPLLMATWKVAPALAAGCTVVLKPSELTPLSALELAKLAQEVGIPAGVLNVITGVGETAGTALVNHPEIDKIAFTGGTDTGMKIMAAAAKGIKKVTLELGGKNPAIVFADADLNKAIEWIAFAGFANQGEVCSAGSRILVERPIYNEVIEKVKKNCAEHQTWTRHRQARQNGTSGVQRTV